MKRIITAITAGLAATMLMSACSNRGGSTESGTTNETGSDSTSQTQAPDPVRENGYSITYYWGPPYENFTEDEVIRMKDAGFDIVPILTFPWEPEKIEKAVALLEKHGLNAAVKDGIVESIYSRDELPTQEEVDQCVRKLVERYGKYGNVKEWVLCDEPNALKFEVLSMFVDAIHRIDPERKAYINLLPTYATPDQLKTATYEEYLDTFCSIVKPDYISYDNYDFLGGDTTSSQRGEFFLNLEYAAAAGKKYGLETRVIVQLVQHIAYSNVSESEIAWQANASLLYGMKSLSYFTYWQPDNVNYTPTSMITIDGVATKHYTDVQNENKITRVLGSALYDTESEKVYRIGDSRLRGVDDYPENGKLGVLTGENALVGFYKNGWFMVMNSEPTKADAPSSLVMSGNAAGYEWLNPESAEWESLSGCSYVKEADGKLTFTLPAGRAVLVRAK